MATDTALNLQQACNNLIQKAKPKDGSAPLEPVISLGNLIIEHEDLLNRALASYRQHSFDLQPKNKP